MEKLYSFDLTLHDFKNLNEVESAGPALRLLKELWVDPFPARETNTTVGIIEVYLDDENRVHIDFKCPAAVTEKLRTKFSRWLKDYDNRHTIGYEKHLRGDK